MFACGTSFQEGSLKGAKAILRDRLKRPSKCVLKTLMTLMTPPPTERGLQVSVFRDKPSVVQMSEVSKGKNFKALCVVGVSWGATDDW